jgi:hypothetical protein
MTEAYPLQWPAGKPRTSYPASSKFGSRSIDQATNILRREIGLLRGGSPVISTNTKLRLDGLPYSKQAQPIDKGVTVYFALKGRQMCFACDRWDKVQDNIYAIAMTIEALRGIERWGSGSMVEQAFTGFVALPAPEQPHQVLGVRPNASVEEIDAAYREKAKATHPDKGGSDAAMARLNWARDTIKRGKP